MTSGTPRGPEQPFDLDLLRADPALRDWLDVLAAVEPADVTLPIGYDLVEALLALGVPHVDVADARAAGPAPGSAASWLVERTASVLLLGLGNLDPHPTPPDYPHVHEVLRWVPLLAMVAAAPHARRWWSERGVGHDVVRATFADVGRHLTHTRRRHGHGGLCVNAGWLALHARGRIVQLGRLQWERSLLSSADAAAIAAQEPTVQAGEPALGCHIPDYCGPFTPAACEASTERAVRFFADVFPDEEIGLATCHSWLLDPALGDHLPPDSNIAAFRRRYRVVPRTVTDDQAVVEFVFGRREDDLDALPQRTSLERAVVGRLRDGGHWTGGLGWHPWPPT